jgi:hypothetical protein
MYSIALQLRSGGGGPGRHLTFAIYLPLLTTKSSRQRGADCRSWTVTRRRAGSRPTWRARIPIIAITSYALSGEGQKARATGCDEYVPKPYSPRHLLAKIRQYLPGWRRVVQWQNWVVEYSRFCCRCVRQKLADFVAEVSFEGCVWGQGFLD